MPGCSASQIASISTSNLGGPFKPSFGLSGVIGTDSRGEPLIWSPDITVYLHEALRCLDVSDNSKSAGIVVRRDVNLITPAA